jgi:hypothetical protein
MAQEKVRIAQGHNNAAGLADFLVEPWVSQIVPGRVLIGLDGTPGEDGWRSADLQWSPAIPNRVKVDALSKCGLTSGSTVRSASVTVRLPSNTDRTIYANYNAKALYLEDDQTEDGKTSGFHIQLLNLQAI